jgi:hypothetical protein
VLGHGPETEVSDEVCESGGLTVGVEAAGIGKDPGVAPAEGSLLTADVLRTADRPARPLTAEGKADDLKKTGAAALVEEVYQGGPGPRCRYDRSMHILRRSPVETIPADPSYLLPQGALATVTVPPNLSSEGICLRTHTGNRPTVHDDGPKRFVRSFDRTPGNRAKMGPRRRTR